MAYDLKRNRGKVSEIRQNIESKKSELAQLEMQKTELLDAVMDVQGAELDDKVKTEVKDAINNNSNLQLSKVVNQGDWRAIMAIKK